MGRWTASRFIEITRGGARADVTADVLALSDTADIYAVRIAMLEDQLRGAVEAERERALVFLRAALERVEVEDCGEAEFILRDGIAKLGGQ